jgi:hypothetical protein
MEALSEYGNWIRGTRGRIRQELGELKGTNDRKKLSELYILAYSSFVGMDRFVSEDEHIVGIESEASEEVEAERAVTVALQELSTTVRDVEAALRQVDDGEEAVVLSFLSGKRIPQSRFLRREAS